MSQRFQGKTAFITGASSGIGAALACQFAREGARVGLIARRLERLEAVRQRIEELGGQALAVACDVREPEALKQAAVVVAETFGGIDVAVANAGAVITEDFENQDTEDFRRLFDINFFGVVDTVYAVLPYLKASNGRLGIVSSILGQIAVPSDTAYCATKFALYGLAGSLWYDLPKGVSVTVILPGFVESEICHKDKSVLPAGHNERSPSFLVTPAEQAAREIVDALYRRQFEAPITRHARWLLFVNRHFPRLFRWLVAAWRQAPRRVGR